MRGLTLEPVRCLASLQKLMHTTFDVMDAINGSPRTPNCGKSGKERCTRRRRNGMRRFFWPVRADAYGLSLILLLVVILAESARGCNSAIGRIDYNYRYKDDVGIENSVDNVRKANGLNGPDPDGRGGTLGDAREREGPRRYISVNRFVFEIGSGIGTKRLHVLHRHFMQLHSRSSRHHRGDQNQRVSKYPQRQDIRRMRQTRRRTTRSLRGL